MLSSDSGLRGSAQGLSARIGADQLGHAQISMTQDKYVGRKALHTEVAEVLDALMMKGQGYA